MSVKLEKHSVCKDCFSIGIIDINCTCAYGKYKTVELEFEVCSCCGNLIEDGNPADTPFNNKQLEK